MKPFFKSFGFAFKGIAFSLKQRNFRIMLGSAILAILLGFFFHIALTEWCIIIICIGLVLALEIINTAIEFFVDLVHPDFHPVAGKIKDLAAGAVLVFSVVALLCGLIVFWKYFLMLF